MITDRFNSFEDITWDIDAEKLGKDARLINEPITANPYKINTWQHKSFCAGWADADMCLSDSLTQYANELGIPELTIDMLIDSHKYLRNNFRNTLNNILIDIDKKESERTLGKDFISVEKLKQMTIEELCSLVVE
jgi:hypothetical protein